MENWRALAKSEQIEPGGPAINVYDELRKQNMANKYRADIRRQLDVDSTTITTTTDSQTNDKKNKKNKAKDATKQQQKQQQHGQLVAADDNKLYKDSSELHRALLVVSRLLLCLLLLFNRSQVRLFVAFLFCFVLFSWIEARRFLQHNLEEMRSRRVHHCHNNKTKKREACITNKQTNKQN